MKVKDIVFDLCILGISLLLLIGGAIQVLEYRTLNWVVFYHIVASALGGNLSWVVFKDLKDNWNK